MSDLDYIEIKLIELVKVKQRSISLNSTIITKQNIVFTYPNLHITVITNVEVIT